MAKAIQQTRTGMTYAVLGNGFRQKAAGAVTLQVHDGDTLNTRGLGNLPIRFLGIDAAEVSSPLPGQRTFVPLGDKRWGDVLKELGKGPLPFLEPGLAQYLKPKLLAKAARNHARHAADAQALLEAEVRKDMKRLRKTEDDFEYWAAFAFEVMDRYGRLLSFIHPNQPDAKKTGQKRLSSYNERLIDAAAVSLYLIWPNINPFRKAASVAAAVFKPGTANQRAESDLKLQAARRALARARGKKTGIFDAKDPLILEGFELRLLSGRRAPERWVIDLSKSDNVLVQPQRYFTIPNCEDRLFIPPEYVPLFVAAGWKKQT